VGVGGRQDTRAAAGATTREGGALGLTVRATSTRPSCGGAALDRVRQRLREWRRPSPDSPTLTVRNQAEYKQYIEDQVNSFLGLVYALLALAIIMRSSGS
jgi:hypothetical protein